MSTQLTFDQGRRVDFSRRMGIIQARATELSGRIIEEARKTAREAGLDSGSPFLSAHNAMCCYGTKSQWPEVNHALARKVLWLEKQSWEPSRLADRIYRREWNKLCQIEGSSLPLYSDNVAVESEAL